MWKSYALLAVSALIWSIVSAYDLASHHNYDAMKKVMEDVHNRCQNITTLYKIPTVELAGVDVLDKTVQGRGLYVIEFSTESKPGVQKPIFKYVANMHGNEVRGREMVLKLMDYLCSMWEDEDTPQEGSFTRNHILWLLENTKIHIMPSMNPDGYEAAANEPRKNGEKNWLIGRSNANDADLNRNFPDLDKLLYANDKMPGHKNNHLDKVKQVLKKYGNELEPETKMIMVWLHSVDFVLSANLHEGDLVANYPFDETEDGSSHNFTPSPDQDTFYYLAHSYSNMHRTMSDPNRKLCDKNGDFRKTNGTTNGANWYSVSGGMQDYNYLSTNIFEITVECGCEKFPPADQLPEIWNDNVDALINFMFQSHIGIKGRIIMPEGQDLQATIKVTDEEKGIYIDHDIISNKNGEYFRLLADGLYTVQAVVEVEAPNGRPVQISRWACVEVVNDPTDFQQAQIVDFDFSNLRMMEDGMPCQMSQPGSYDSPMDVDEQQYYNIVSLLKKLEAQKYPYY